MVRNLDELSLVVSGRIVGDGSIKINGVGGADNAQNDEITFAQDKKFFKEAEENAAAIIVSEEFSNIKSNKPLLVVDNPRKAFARIAKLFMPQPYYRPGISEQAHISSQVELGDNVSIHAGVVIEAGAKIGNNVVLAPGVYVGHNVEIGADSTIHPNVVIEYDSQLGERVEVNSGAVIGCEGYGFETSDEGHIKVPQFGNVVIEDDVELGANVTVDRAATGATIVGQGTKIDNLVHIAHNVKIGPECLIIAQVGIAGSAEIGRRVTLAGKSGVVGHLTIGDNTTLAAYSVITHNVKSNSFLSGYPAHDHRKERRIKAARKRLPGMVKRMRRLESRISDLEEKLVREEEE